MPKPYSLDLRERVVRFVDEGHSRHATAAEQDRSPKRASAEIRRPCGRLRND
jgi:hypothetical protein